MAHVILRILPAPDVSSEPLQIQDAGRRHRRSVPVESLSNLRNQLQLFGLAEGFHLAQDGFIQGRHECPLPNDTKFEDGIAGKKEAIAREAVRRFDERSHWSQQGSLRRKCAPAAFSFSIHRSPP